MGEIAEMMLEGTLCCQCGACLGEKIIDMNLGIPVICEDCYTDLSDKEKKDYEGRNEKELLTP